MFSFGQLFCASHYSLEVSILLLRSVASIWKGKYVFVIEDIEDTSGLAVGRPITYVSDIDIMRRLPQGDSITGSMQKSGILTLVIHPEFPPFHARSVIPIRPGDSFVGSCEVLMSLVCLSLNLPTLTGKGFYVGGRRIW